MCRWSFLLPLLVFLSVQDAVFGAEGCEGGLERCDWEHWGPWSPCNKLCGTGLQTRQRGICCSLTETIDKCIEKCNLPDETYESKPCEHVCPAGNCSVEIIKDTGIDATDFKELSGLTPDVILNSPLHLLSRSFEDCRKTCFNMDLGNGLHCWTFTYSDREKCFLYFFPHPLILARPENKGKSQGQSLYIRHCTGTVECKATSADIVFVVDSSGSIGAENFEKMKTFLQSLVMRFDVDPDLTRVGMLVFNDHIKWQFKLGELNNMLDVLKAIQKIQYVVGGTLTSDALETVRTEGFVSNRTGVPQIVVVLTDGLSRYPPLTRVRASMLRQLGIQLYAIGVGDKLNQEELYNMASLPEEKYMYEFSNFDDLDADNITIQTDFLPCKEKQSVNFTTPKPTVIVDNCTDTIDNCQLYGNDICTDFGPWAHAHCSLFCGFCKPIVTTNARCFDKLPNCASYGNYICQDRAFVDWTNTNCRKYCGICASSDRTTTKTTPIPTTTVKICEDTIDNCDGYLSSCNDPKYRGYLEARCPAACGYCISHKTVQPTTVNGIKCPEWSIPTECYMATVSPDCCPLPKCPDGYVSTVEKLDVQT